MSDGSCMVCGESSCMLTERQKSRERDEEAKKELNVGDLVTVELDTADVVLGHGHTVSDLPFHHDVITIRSTDSAEKGLRVLIDNHINSAPVVAPGTAAPVGVLDGTPVAVAIAWLHGGGGLTVYRMCSCGSVAHRRARQRNRR